MIFTVIVILFVNKLNTGTLDIINHLTKLGGACRKLTFQL